MILKRLKQSVRFKLLTLMLSTTLVALLVAGAALMVYDSINYRERIVADLTTQAEILGRSSVPALAFDDPRAARENLDLLKVRPSIVAAAVYDDKGRLFARYVRERVPTTQQSTPTAVAGSRCARPCTAVTSRSP